MGLESDALKSTFLSNKELFGKTLSSFALIDIGTIEGLNEQGRARVVSSTFVNNKPVVYDDAELIFPGNANGAYTCNPINMACLIFIPRSCMPDIGSLVLRLGASSYNRDGIKAMPISNGSTNIVKAAFSDGGYFTLTNQVSSIQFTDDTLMFEKSDGTTQLSVDGTGQVYVSYQTANGQYNKSIEDGKVTTSWLNKDKDVLWTDTLNSDGSRTLVQSNPNDESADPMFSITIGNDGTVQIDTAADISVSSKGDVSVSSEGDVSVSADGDATIDAGGDVSVSADGNATIDATEIDLNGNDTSLVTYTELNNAFNALGTGLMTALNSHVHSGGILDGVTGAPTSPMTLDLSAAEASTVKTKASGI